MLSVPALSQNTKGDRPGSNRESRFKKSPKKEKPSKRIKSNRTTSLRAYKPRKKSKGGELAGRPVSPIFNSKPSEKPKNVFPQSGPYVNNKSKTAKEARRRLSSNQSGRFVNSSSTSDRKPPRKKKVVPRTASRSFISRRSINSWATFPRAKQKREKAFTKDIAGRPLRTKNFETKRPGIISVPKGRVNSVSSKIKRSASRSTRFTPVRTRRTQNVFPQSGRYVNNRSKTGKNVQQISNRPTLAKLGRLQKQQDKRPGKKVRVTPRSASGAFIARRSTNTWAHFPRPKRKGEKAFTKDISGHPLRTKNFETRRPEVIPSTSPYYKRKRIGDRPYKGPSARYSSATRGGKAWRGDITNRRIRRNFFSKRKIEGEPTYKPQGKIPHGERLGKKLKGGGFKTASKSAERRTGKFPLAVRPPGIGAKGIDKYQGKIKGRKGLNPQGEGYSGNIKARRPLKGGGTISGRIWNNQGRAIATRIPGIGGRGIGKYQGNIKGRKGLNDQGEEYSGNIKARRPVKGGGSISGKLWNNRQQAVAGRTPGIGGRGIDKYQGNIKGRKGFNNQGEEFTGNIKARRPIKGGGSVSGKLWNNRQQAIAGRTPGIGGRGIDKYQGNIKGRKGFNNQGEEYTGNIKARRPVKGGGSVSGKLWNNRQQAIAGRTPGIGGKGIDKYQGNIRGTRGFNNQGEEYTGSIKARRPLKGGGSVSGKLWNNKETPIPGMSPAKSATKIEGFPGKIKRFALKPGFRNQGEEFTGNMKAKRPEKGGGSISGKLWNNKETAIAVRVPREEQGGEYRGSIKSKRNYVKNDNAADLALKKLKPTAATYRTGHLQVKVKQHYVKNPNAADEALKSREPGKAFGRSGDFQGNIKMRKFELFAKRDLHPDAKFIKTNKNNVAEERDLLTNLKLWWARLFKKNDNQPDHLKDKRGRPRYDKGESGLWYD